MIALDTSVPRTAPQTNEVEGIRGRYADLWRAIDELLERIGTHDWSRRHGKDWTFGDVPFHLAYFDAEIVCQPIERRHPTADLVHAPLMGSMREMDAWNARHFRERPAGQTPEHSLAQMRASRAQVRALLDSVSDAELDQRVWIPLIGCGWVPLRFGLLSGIGHTWSHFIQLRRYLGTPAEADVTADTTHKAIGMFVSLLPVGLDRAAAARLKAPFTAALEFSGPGGGCWVVRVTPDGQCRVDEEPAPRDAALTLRQTPQTFELMRVDMANPLWLLLSSQIKIRGFAALGTFGKLFPKPGLDTPIKPLSS
ncbi:MAG TPA: DinB family protein [Chloroflexota bacterium]|nr:DinB family protein [Chloroflexota bacterium]